MGLDFTICKVKTPSVSRVQGGCESSQERGERKVTWEGAGEGRGCCSPWQHNPGTPQILPLASDPLLRKDQSTVVAAGGGWHAKAGIPSPTFYLVEWVT